MLLRKLLLKRCIFLFFCLLAFNLNAKLSQEAESTLKDIDLENLSILERFKFKANFAEHFEIVEWGCGAPCTQSVIIELSSGNIVDFLDSCYSLRLNTDSNSNEFINI